MGEIVGSMYQLLDARSAEAFESSHTHVQSLLRGKPSLQKYVKSFYTKAKKYALYELRKIEGKRYLKGSSHAEQNHF